MRATGGTSRTSLRDVAQRWPVPQAAAMSIVAGLALAIFLLVRRANGEFSVSLSTAQLVVTAFVVTAWAAIVRALSMGMFQRQLATLAPLCVLLMFAVACSYPGTRFIDWLVWIAASAVFALCCIAQNARPKAAWIHHPDARALEEKGSTAIDTDGSKGDHQLLQQITRYRDAEGRDVVHGELIAEFAPGARQTTLYAPFCPPFERLPNVEVNVADDSDATVKLAQVLHNGAQLEVRLPDPAEDPCQISIELYATEAES